MHADPHQFPHQRPKWDDIEPKTGRTLYEVAKRFMPNFHWLRPEHREEVLHDFIEKHPNFEGFEGRSKPTTWLYRALSNFSVSFVRKKYQTRVDPEKRIKWISLQMETDEGEIVDYEVPIDPVQDVIYEVLDKMEEMGGVITQGDVLADFGLSIFNILSHYGWIMENVKEVLELQEQLEEKKKLAIEGLLKEKQQIDSQLALLGYRKSGEARPIGQRTCSNCGKTGHNAKTCPEPKKHNHKK